jgi:formate dehydrogenase subunit delta
METKDMVRMANQIGTFFKGYGQEEGTKEIANHMNSYWEPRMRREFLAFTAKGGAGLEPMVIAAAALVRKPKDEAA